MTVSNKNRQAGFTIIELMVAITLGLLILAGLTTIFVQNSQARNEIERANQQVENGRYAMQILTDDLRNAGYLAEFNPGPLPTPTAKPDPCAIDLATLRSALPLAVQGYDNQNTASKPSCLSDIRSGTDILVVRRASTCVAGPVADTGCDAVPTSTPPPYIQASGCTPTQLATELSSATVADYYVLDTDTTKLTLHQKNCNPPTTAGTIAPYHQYRTHIYFIANNDKAGDGIPTLKRAELVGGPTASITCSPTTNTPPCFTIVPLVEGIENLQIEYGIDTSTPTTGAPALFTADPDSYSSCTGAVCVGYWRNTVAAKINLLARNTTPTAGYSDGKTYTLGLKFNGTANTIAAANDAYKRHAYESVVRLNNTAGRNTP